eukprot:jgi/Picre1/32314/NNA_007660.t1
MGAIDDKLADAAGRAQHRSQSITSGKKEGRGVHGADVEDDQLSLCTPVNPMHGNQRVLEEEVRMNESGENVLPEYMPYSKGYLAEGMHGMDRRLGSNRSSGKSSSATFHVLITIAKEGIASLTVIMKGKEWDLEIDHIRTSVMRVPTGTAHPQSLHTSARLLMVDILNILHHPRDSCRLHRFNKLCLDLGIQGCRMPLVRGWCLIRMAQGTNDAGTVSLE